MITDGSPGRDVAGEPGLDRLFWRAEILQAMYWMEGEGIASAVSPTRLAEFLDTAPSTMAARLRQLVGDGFLAPLADDPARFAMTDAGRREGTRSFGDEFAALTRPAHAECGPGCWCHDPKHAEEPCPGDRGVGDGR